MKTTFYIADDIQTLSDGKLMLIGVYPDDTLVIQDQVTQPGEGVVLARLAMLVHVSEMPRGIKQVQPSITFPDGTPARAIDPLKVHDNNGRPANLLCRFQPFPLPQVGTYKLEFQLGTKRITHEFFVRAGEPSIKKGRPAPQTKTGTVKPIGKPSAKAKIKPRR